MILKYVLLKKCFAKHLMHFFFGELCFGTKPYLQITLSAARCLSLSPYFLHRLYTFDGHISRPPLPSAPLPPPATPRKEEDAWNPGVINQFLVFGPLRGPVNADLLTPTMHRECTPTPPSPPPPSPFSLSIVPTPIKNIYGDLLTHHNHYYHRVKLSGSRVNAKIIMAARKHGQTEKPMRTRGHVWRT